MVTFQAGDKKTNKTSFQNRIFATKQEGIGKYAILTMVYVIA